MSAPETRETAFRDGLVTLRELVLERLLEILRQGATVPAKGGALGEGGGPAKRPAAAEAARAPTAPAHLSAAIRFLKDNQAWLSEGAETDALDDLLGDLSEPDFEDEGEAAED